MGAFVLSNKGCYDYIIKNQFIFSRGQAAYGKSGLMNIRSAIFQ